MISKTNLKNNVANLRGEWWMYLLKFTTTGLIVGTVLTAGLLASEDRYDVLWSYVSVLMIVGVTLLVVAISLLTGAIPSMPKNIEHRGSALSAARPRSATSH